jgi:hypothetical protein
MSSFYLLLFGATLIRPDGWKISRENSRPGYSHFGMLMLTPGYNG